MVFMWKHMCRQSYNDGKINHSSHAICTENVETQYCEKTNNSGKEDCRG